MADITKCKGTNCPMAIKCYRYTAKESSWQSYFLEVPFVIIDNKLKCDMYWGENAQDIMNQLNNIF